MWSSGETFCFVSVSYSSSRHRSIVVKILKVHVGSVDLPRPFV